MTRNVEHPDETKLTGDEWKMVRDAFQGLRFGTIILTLQDGVLVQLDRLEKRRARGKASSNNTNRPAYPPVDRRDSR